MSGFMAPYISVDMDGKRRDENNKQYATMAMTGQVKHAKEG